MGEGERENSAVLTPMGRREHSARRPRWDLRPLIAAVAAVAAVAALVSSWHFASPGVSDLLGTRLSGTQSRWQEEARAAQAAARARKAQTLDLRFRRLTLQSRIARKTAQLAARRAQRQTPLAKEVAQEFDAWTTSWHHTHPGASLAKERAAWHAREGELGRIAAWEARQRRRVATLQAADHVEDGGADENASPTGAANVAESTAAAVLTADVIKGIHAPAPASEDAIAHAADLEDGGADENASPTGAANVAENTAAAVPTADVIKGIHAPAPAKEDANGDAASVSSADMFRCVARIERGVKASGASAADVMSAVRGAMHTKGIKISDIEKTLEANGISLNDVAAALASGTLTDMQHVIKEKHVDMQTVLNVMTSHHISCADIADMISSIRPSAMEAHAKDDAPVPATGAGEEPKEFEAPAVDEAGVSTVGGAEAGTEEEAVKIEHDLEAQVAEDEVKEERVEEKVEEGLKENVVKEEEEAKNKEEEAQLTPGERQKERVAEARREVAEHNAYWDNARMNMDKEPCEPATFWFENTIDPRPRCKKPQATLSYDGPKVMPPEIPPEPMTEEGPQQTILGVPDGQPDFNGADAVLALHPFLGHNPTDLEERGGETRGSFSVVSTHSGFDNEGEVSLSVFGPPKVPRHRNPQP